MVQELRNALGTAALALRALDLGNMTVRGATGAVLSRSLEALNLLIGGALVEVRGEKPGSV